jgi:hypothetical protein
MWSLEVGVEGTGQVHNVRLLGGDCLPYGGQRHLSGSVPLLAHLPLPPRNVQRLSVSLQAAVLNLTQSPLVRLRVRLPVQLPCRLALPPLHPLPSIIPLHRQRVKQRNGRKVVSQEGFAVLLRLPRGEIISGQRQLWLSLVHG